LSYSPLRFRHRLMVGVGLAYMITGPLLIAIFFTILSGWFAQHVLTVAPSLLLVIDGFLLIGFSTLDVDWVIEVVKNDVHLVVTNEEKLRLMQMSRWHNTVLFAAITANAVVSFLITDMVQPAIMGVLSDRVLAFLYTFSVYGIPLVVIPISIFLFTSAKYGDVRPILSAAMQEFLKKVRPGFYEMKEKEKER
jgi:hypothetical protein